MPWPSSLVFQTCKMSCTRFHFSFFDCRRIHLACLCLSSRAYRIHPVNLNRLCLCFVSLNNIIEAWFHPLRCVFAVYLLVLRLLYRSSRQYQFYSCVKTDQLRFCGTVRTSVAKPSRNSTKRTFTLIGSR